MRITVSRGNTKIILDTSRDMEITLLTNGVTNKQLFDSLDNGIYYVKDIQYVIGALLSALGR